MSRKRPELSSEYLSKRLNEELDSSNTNKTVLLQAAQFLHWLDCSSYAETAFTDANAWYEAVEAYLNTRRVSTGSVSAYKNSLKCLTYYTDYWRFYPLKEVRVGNYPSVALGLASDYHKKIINGEDVRKRLRLATEGFIGYLVITDQVKALADEIGFKRAQDIYIKYKKQSQTPFFQMETTVTATNHLARALGLQMHHDFLRRDLGER